MALDYLRTEVLDEILARVDEGKIRVVVVNGHRFSLRLKGKEFGYVDRRKSEIRWNSTTYQTADETDGKKFHTQVSKHQGITHV